MARAQGARQQLILVFCRNSEKGDVKVSDGLNGEEMILVVSRVFLVQGKAQGC
jgi:hypothetical protein